MTAPRIRAAFPGLDFLTGVCGMLSLRKGLLYFLGDAGRMLLLAISDTTDDALRVGVPILSGSFFSGFITLTY